MKAKYVPKGEPTLVLRIIAGMETLVELVWANRRNAFHWSWRIVILDHYRWREVLLLRLVQSRFEFIELQPRLISRESSELNGILGNEG